MNYVRYRKHPRVYTKQHPEEEERVLNVSAIAAVGVLAFAFVKGMFWGYMLKRKIG